MTQDPPPRATTRHAAVREGADATPVTVEQLLATSQLNGTVDVVGGNAGLARPVLDALVGTIGEPIPAAARLHRAMIVLDSRSVRADSFQIDLALRAALDGQASGVLLCGPRSLITLAATRFADKVGIPLIIASTHTPLAVADHIRRVVQTPAMVRSTVLLDSLEVLQGASTKDPVGGVLSRLGPILNADVCVIGADGTLLAGAQRGSPLSTAQLLVVPSIVREGPVVFATQPLSLASGERPTFWISARLDSPTATWQSLAADVLGMAAWFVTSRLVADRLERERDARFRLGVLNSIISGQDRPEPVLLEQLAILGWQVDGWCTGIQLQASGEASPLRILTLTDELSRQLKVAGVHGPLVERPDGWSLWTVAKDEPVASSYTPLVTAIRRAAELFTTSAPRLRLHVGIGRPYQGIGGLRTSLAESMEAATIAQAAGDIVGVQHIDEMGVRRILLGWYASDSFAEFARTLLGPVLSVDPDGELLLTLESYLDHESSATLASSDLAVHRNTVLNRLDRLRSLLTVNLNDPDERLAVQLACRVIKLKRAEQQNSI